MQALTFIGGGNMAAAIIGGLVASGTAPASLEVVEIDPGARAVLADRFGVAVYDALEAATLAGMVVLAVKPQTLPAVASRLAPRLTTQPVLSVAAGVRVPDLARWLGGHTAIVRAMPNTPALVQAGISGLYAAPGVDTATRQAAESVLRAVGSVVWVDDEAALDWVTAVSGSGPAYVFNCIEALEAAAVAGGLAPATARQLALHTFLGAARLALESGEEPAVLRQRVTSKGGTTERGLAALEAGGLMALFQNAVNAAQARSVELGTELGRLG